MNCCNAYGQCDQGRDCPARTGAVLPHQARHAARVAADLPVQFVGDEPAEPTGPLCQCLPLSRRESLGIAAFMLVGCLAWLAAVAAMLGYAWARWPTDWQLGRVGAYLLGLLS